MPRALNQYEGSDKSRRQRALELDGQRAPGVTEREQLAAGEPWTDNSHGAEAQ